jgi:5-hydroxyisourate hydrolase
MSQITTHILDTAKGCPAAGIIIILYQGQGDFTGTTWTELARGITNADGRIPDLLKKDALLPHGMYKMRFETKDYFDRTGTATFYPFIQIVFTVTTNEHYHIPLLLNPFGYTTYRGS